MFTSRYFFTSVFLLTLSFNFMQAGKLNSIKSQLTRENFVGATIVIGTTAILIQNYFEKNEHNLKNENLKLNNKKSDDEYEYVQFSNGLMDKDEKNEQQELYSKELFI